ncbi:hypothetical protein Agub_g11752, partial [Astrephomene gubernaculifera]
EAVQAAQGNPAGSGVRLHLLGNYTWIQAGRDEVKPPFKYPTGVCFVNPVSSMVITPGLQVCARPDEYMFYEEMHVGSRFHQWFANKGVLPRLQELGLLLPKV